MRNIRLAKTAGFCFGVNRAVEMVENLLSEGKKVCTLGEIIHNSQLVESLAERGARTVDSVEEVAPDEILVIRSHGVEASVYKKAEELGLQVVDATCPYVGKIHRIVARESADGRVVFIAGDANHSEVKGIAGHVNGRYYVFATPEEMEQILEKEPELAQTPVSMVAQTTFNATLWQKFQENFKKLYTNGKFFDTICSATSNRQQEAKQLAQECGTMIVIGGRHSSNTVKLKDVCSSMCENTWHIETVGELKPQMLKGFGDIGVVAGASTPACIIKEVLKQMSENVVNAELNVEQAMELAPENEAAETVEVQQKSFEEMTFEEALEASLSGMNTDQRVKGTVLAVSPTEIQVDIGRKHTGYIPSSEYSNDPNAKIMDEVHVGDVLDLILMKTNDQEGTVLLSKRRYDVSANWNTIVDAKESGAIIEGTVSEIIKGGVIAVTNGVRVFIPASQTGVARNDSLEELKGQNVSFRIIDIGRRRQAIGSIKSVSREQRKELAEKFWSNVAVGDKFTGTVKSLTGYGAFVDLGGVDGMVHISEMSWARIKNPSEVMNVGDTVEVYVKALDTEKKKVSLGYRKAEDNPFVKLQEQYQIGDVA
ncbi:MAG: 4-hydroxy-3-methylbut-2-enyl diphosphate reductase, partial [Clostridia bacterium]|nr:4-hydroxy-3-methylbut-2-enyl diphosphate reductase [Clostridia bacterium]